MKYWDLTQGQRETLWEEGIINGCGPSSWRGMPPSFFFTASCNEHDFNYLVGGTEEDRRWYDRGFYTAMLKDTYRLPWWKRPVARFLAWRMYQLVRWFGAKHFNHRPTPATSLSEITSG